MGRPGSELVDLKHVEFGPLSNNDSVFAAYDGVAHGDLLSLTSDHINAVATNSFFIACLKRPSIGHTLRETAFGRVWRELMTHQVIPYDSAARQVEFGHAYQTLAAYLNRWERLRSLGASEISKRFYRNPRTLERL